MKLWRLVRPGHEALDGEGARRHGGRYASAGRPLVPFASEVALAVLIAMRYVEPDGDTWQAEYRLGWTQSDTLPERLPEGLDDAGKTAWVDAWAQGQRSLLAALPSAVLPEGDVVLMNPLHRDAASLPPLTTRTFRFDQCLHRPPMLDRYRKAEQEPR